VPTDAVNETVSAAFASDHVPELVAVAPSLTVTAPLSRLMTGATFVTAVNVAVMAALLPKINEQGDVVAVHVLLDALAGALQPENVDPTAGVT
jgi:hypothetical protein